MNNSNNKKTPRFQPASERRFQERSVGEGREPRFSRDNSRSRDGQSRDTKWDNKKFDQKAPHFKGREERSKEDRKPYRAERNERFNDRFNDRSERKPFRAPRDMQEVREQRITELSLNKAGNETGQVKVMVKGSGVSLQPKEKKTGALSPRAPEKIKKNRAEEMKVYGENACLELFAQRPESIVRVWTTVQMSHKVGELFSYLAANKKVYHVVDNEELNLVSGSEHHGGICMLVKKSRPFTLQGYLEVERQQDCLVLLDGVQNAQNLGGVLRTCAYYGVKSVIVENADNVLSAAALRVAEGGAEHIRLLETADNLRALDSLRQADYQIVHINHNRQGEPLDKVRLKNKVVFVLSESSTENLAKPQDSQIRLSLTNPLKNGLNIAVNTGILLAQWYFK